MKVAKVMELIRAKKGNEFVTILTKTEAKVRKTGNPFGTVYKVCKMNVCVGFSYENSINLQRSREEMEADFVAQPRKWGTRLDSKTVEHKGKHYLTFKPEKVLMMRYEDSTGKEISDEEIKPFLFEKPENKTQGTEKEIIYRDVSYDNLKEITLRGETIQID